MLVFVLRRRRRRRVARRRRLAQPALSADKVGALMPAIVLDEGSDLLVELLRTWPKRAEEVLDEPPA